MLMPAIFFFSLMIIGNYMLLNLFLAILLKFIAENNEGEDSHEGECAHSTKAETTADKSFDGMASSRKKMDTSVQREDSIALNSSNSNIEEEFEQIKLQL